MDSISPIIFRYIDGQWTKTDEQYVSFYDPPINGIRITIFSKPTIRLEIVASGSQCIYEIAEYYNDIYTGENIETYHRFSDYIIKKFNNGFLRECFFMMY